MNRIFPGMISKFLRGEDIILRSEEIKYVSNAFDISQIPGNRFSIIFTKRGINIWTFGRLDVWTFGLRFWVLMGRRWETFGKYQPLLFCKNGE